MFFFENNNKYIKKKQDSWIDIKIGKKQLIKLIIKIKKTEIFEINL